MIGYAHRVQLLLGFNKLYKITTKSKLTPVLPVDVHPNIQSEEPEESEPPLFWSEEYFVMIIVERGRQERLKVCSTKFLVKNPQQGHSVAEQEENERLEVGDELEEIIPTDQAPASVD